MNNYTNELDIYEYKGALLNACMFQSLRNDYKYYV